jgi:metalloendopeptidase OMA1, mitochondrial
MATVTRTDLTGATKPGRAPGRELRAMPHRLLPGRRLLVLLCLGAAACGHGRFARRSSVERAGEREFTEMMTRKGYRYAATPALTAPVMRVAARILDAARASEYAAGAGQIRWDVAVIDAPDIANAFATPGGRIIVFTGLFPAARTEAGLAAVLGHEVAHVLEEHSAKEDDLRRSTESAAAITALLAGAAAGFATKNADLGGRVVEAVDSNLKQGALQGTVLPYSRRQEIEADRIGVELAARAGYDPREALTLLDRIGDPQSSPRLSDHPSLTERRAGLQVWSSDALRFFRGNAPGAQDPLPDPEAIPPLPDAPKGLI